MYDNEVNRAIDYVREQLELLPAGRLVDKDIDTPISKLTLSEVWGIAGGFLQQTAPFDVEKATEIFRAYPQMLAMEQPRAFMKMGDTLKNTFTTVLLQPKSDVLRALVLKQYENETLQDVMQVFDKTIELNSRLPQPTIFRGNEPDDLMLPYFNDYFGTFRDEKDVRDMGGEDGLLIRTIDVVNDWVRYLKDRTPEAKRVARELKEANQMLTFIRHDKVIDLAAVRPQPPAPAI